MTCTTVNISEEYIMERKLEFDPDSHQYTVDGVPIPCVTDLVSILGEDLSKPDDVFELTLEAARERGTLLHGYLEHRMDGGDPEAYEIPDAYAGYVDAIELYLAEHTFEPMLVETPLFSDCCGVEFAGTPDYVGGMDGTLTLCDYKFVSAVSKTRVGAQCNAYMTLLAGNDCFPEQIRAVQFLPDGTYRIYPVKDDNTDFELCLQVWKTKNKLQPRGAIG